MGWRTAIGIFGAIALACGATAAQASAQGIPSARALIPQAYHGAWAHRLEDCARTGEGTPVRIRDDRIIYYESLAVVRSADLLSPREIVIHAGMIGEGDTWKADIRLSLSQDGRVLTLSGADNRAKDERVKCPSSPGS
jgi:hypothetical protein